MTTTEHVHAESDPAVPVTVMGLGLMGHALAEAFVTAGHPTTVWNRSAGKGAGLADRGARPAGSASEAATAGSLVVVCVTDNDAVRELVRPLAGELRGHALVNLTSGSSGEARDLAAWAAEHEIAYLDGAIMAAPGGIGSGDAAILYAGDKGAFDEHGRTLRKLAAPTFLGDDPGLAALHDVAVLAVMWNILNAFLHGAALLQAAGVPATALTPVLEGGIATTTGWLAGYAEQIDAGAFPGDDATIATHLAAMTHLVDESTAHGIDPALPLQIKALAERAAAEGLGQSGYAALISQFRR
ncbi:NAD(P)-binding domain-containing protein [Spirillospora sp. NPDC048819]|uniref:NAD(P)-dependent oxidoreductase n=1 Tax=Spirillospora sp. NPDC048819 TaxID=3155268 RepID=UPI0033E341BA